MDTSSRLNQLIEQTSAIINLLECAANPDNNSIELTDIQGLIGQRDQQIHQFFSTFTPSQYTGDELAALAPLLNELAAQDEQLLSLATSIKSELAQAIIKQKRHAKVKQAYNL